MPPISSAWRCPRSPTSSPPPKPSPTAELAADRDQETRGRPMPIEILMPALSPTMTEGNLAKWHKKVGDTVKAGDVVAEIETDKATMEVEAVDEGVVQALLVPEGTEEVKVNTPIARLSGEGGDASPPPGGAGVGGGGN